MKIRQTHAKLASEKIAGARSSDNAWDTCHTYREYTVSHCK